MFGGAYDSCSNFDRPKYGVLNLTGDIRGVQVARSYGAFVLTLKPHVRYRTTFFGKDTGGFAKDGALATHDLYAHVLQSYRDEELRAVLDVHRISGGPSTTIRVYKEIQIHGPICLATDIQTVSVPGKETEASCKLRKDVTQFQRMTECAVMWQGDLAG